MPIKDDPAHRSCLVLEYADGCDLRNMLNTLKKPIPEKLALMWFAEACLGLARMHEKRIAHRDLKPENILLTCGRHGGVAKIADFGCQKYIREDERQTYQIGTGQYFAPEKIKKNYDMKVDVWSMGIVLYEMLTGGEHPVEFDFEKYSLLEYMMELPHLKLK